MLISALQVFSIGLFLGLSLPCLIYCLPVILALNIHSGNNFKKISAGLLLFFLGRLLAYILLGALAGVSGYLLNQFIGASLNFYSKLIAGLISIGFGLYVLFYRRQEGKRCSSNKHQVLTNGEFFIFGLTVGISPCPPLMGLLLEVALISKNPLQGSIYGLMFGLGTFVTGFILATGLSHIFNWLPDKLMHSELSKAILKFLYASLLVLFGVFLISRAGL